MTGIALALGKAGFLLFTLGLVMGAIIPKFTNPRMGLSAHLTAVQTGTALIAFGLFWSYFGLSKTASAIFGASLIASAYLLVFGLALAAAFGASATLPIAGKGFATSPSRERTVSVIVIGTSVWMTLSCIGICLVSAIS